MTTTAMMKKPWLWFQSERLDKVAAVVIPAPMLLPKTKAPVKTKATVTIETTRLSAIIQSRDVEDRKDACFAREKRLRKKDWTC